MDWLQRETSVDSGKSLGDALAAYIDAAVEERKARESYDGYEWGYAGDRHITRVQKAALDVDSAIRLIIRNEIAATDTPHPAA